MSNNQKPKLTLNKLGIFLEAVSILALGGIVFYWSMKEIADPNFEIISSLKSLILPIAICALTLLVKVTISIESFLENTSDHKEKMEKLCASSDEILSKMSEVISPECATVKLIQTMDEFYEMLNTSRSRATKRALLMQLDFLALGAFGVDARTQYFNSDVDF